MDGPLERPLPSVEVLVFFSAACCEVKVACEGEKCRFDDPADCCRALDISAAAIAGFKEPSRFADAKRFCCGTTAGGDVESTDLKVETFCWYG